MHLAEVNFSRFGFTGGAKPAVKASEGTTVDIKGITLGGGGVMSQKDETSVVDWSNCFGVNCPKAPKRTL